MVSIIVPVYNAEKYIEATIKTVQKQTYEDWELILVDDCSTDRSVEVIKKYIGENEKIRLICKTINGGAAKARNTGIDAARGRYIAFLDADDIWYREKLEKQMAFMEKHDAAFVFTAYEFGDESGMPTGKAVHVPKTLDYKAALSRTVIFTSTVLMDTEKVERKLLYMPEIGSEDTATWWKILKSGIIANGLDESLAIYRRPAQSLSSNKKTAVRRIWNLYRTVAELTVVSALYYLFFWAFRATIRRIVADTIRMHAESVKRFVVLELSMVGLILQTLLYAYVWFYRYYPLVNSFRFSQEGFQFGHGLKLYFRGHLLVLVIYLVILFFLTRVGEGMKTGYLKPGNIFASQVTALVITNVITYFQISLMRNWLVPAEDMIVLTMAQIVFAGVWAFGSDSIYRAVFPPVETLVIHGKENFDPLFRNFCTRQDRFRIMRVLKAEGNLQEIKDECVRWYGAVVMGDMENDFREELLEFCYSHYIRVYFLPDIADILIQGSEVMDLFRIPIFEVKEYSINWEQRVIKRGMDILVSGILLTVFSPLLAGRAVYGKIKYKRVIAGQSCVTKSNKPFVLHTFATDHENKSGIDRLPMLWDVLRGKMSLVGPRPLAKEEMERLIRSDKRFIYRLRVKAGLTGYAQLYGSHTLEKADLLKLDLIYIQRFSVMLDFKLLLFSMRRSENTEKRR